MVLSLLTALVLSLAAVKAENHQVTVGQGGFVFTPNTVTAQTGDTIEFVFSGTHGLVSSDFTSPCSSNGQVYSGLSPQPNFVITVNSTSPQFFYCPVAGHCQGGMVFAVNPSGSESFAAYQSAAEQTSSSVNPSGGPVGGFSGPVPSSSSSASTAATGSSSSAAVQSASSTVSSPGSPAASSSGAAGTTAASPSGPAAAGTTSPTIASSSAGNTIYVFKVSGKVLVVLSGIVLAGVLMM